MVGSISSSSGCNSSSSSLSSSSSSSSSSSRSNRDISIFGVYFSNNSILLSCFRAFSCQPR